MPMIRPVPGKVLSVSLAAVSVDCVAPLSLGPTHKETATRMFPKIALTRLAHLAGVCATFGSRACPIIGHPIQNFSFRKHFDTAVIPAV